MINEFSLLDAQEFVFASVFVVIVFHTKKSTAHLLFATEIDNPPPNPPQVHHELPCCQNYTWDDGEESDQDGNWGGVCCEGKG